MEIFKENEEQTNQAEKCGRAVASQSAGQLPTETTELCGRVDVCKIVNDYQKKFSVPKPLIIKWLNLKSQKSLFSGSTSK